MGKKRLKKSIRQVVVFAVMSVLILSSVLFFLLAYQRLNDNIQKERTDYVSEISEQLRSNISSVRSTNLQLAVLFSDMLSYVQPDTFEGCDALFHNYLSGDGGSIFFVAEDGTVLSLDGAVERVENRDYISQVLKKDRYSAFDKVGMDNEYWLFSALLDEPCRIEEYDIRAVIFAWEKEIYSENMTISIFEGLGYSFLVTENGTITVAPEAIVKGNIGFNILSTLKEQGIEKAVYDKIQKDLQKGKENSIVCKLNKTQWLLQYNRLEEGNFTFVMVPLALTAAGTYSGMNTTMLAVLVVIFSLAALVIYVILAGTAKEKQRQKEIYEISLAKKAVEAKNDFLAKMSHDIRTPLNGIIGMNYIAAKQLGQDHQEVRESLEKIDTSSKYLLSIINDILDMSKIESGNMQISCKPFLMEEVLRNVQNMLEVTAADKQLEFETVYRLDTKCAYIGDPLRLNQILMNLLSNAFKFTEQGKVRLEVSVRRKDQRSDEAVMIISDTGVGMSEEYLQKVFTPFLQESAEIAENYGGSGLGLSIVKNLVELMDGTLSVRSKKGEGTEFTVRIPFERTERAEADREREEKPEKLIPEGKRILVAEDNDLNAEITMEILKMEGLKAEWAKNGREAVEMFEASEKGYYAMILMDIHMPEMDGLTAAKTIRRSRHADAAVIPVCAVSANAFEDDVEASEKVGMNTHLKKPLEIEKLNAVLKQYLG